MPPLQSCDSLLKVARKYRKKISECCTSNDHLRFAFTLVRSFGKRCRHMYNLILSLSSYDAHPKVSHRWSLDMLRCNHYVPTNSYTAIRVVLRYSFDTFVRRQCLVAFKAVFLPTSQLSIPPPSLSLHTHNVLSLGFDCLLTRSRFCPPRRAMFFFTFQHKTTTHDFVSVTQPTKHLHFSERALTS